MRERAFGGLQHFEQMFANQAFEFRGIAEHFAIDALADALEDLRGGLDADVGGDQRVLELLEEVGVDLFPSGNEIFDTIDQPGAGLLNASLELLEEIRLLRLGAKQRLNSHLNLNGMNPGVSRYNGGIMNSSRRQILLGAAALALPVAAAPRPVVPVVEGVPRVDYHAHPEGGMTVDRAVALSKELGVKLGLVEHAGVKPSADSKLAGNDAELNAWIDSLRGKGVFCGIQAEGLDWASAFSKATIARLDYVLSDALTLPDRSGKPVKIYTAGYMPDDITDFMERYVDFHLRVLANGRLDILANPTFLPRD